MYNTAEEASGLHATSYTIGCYTIRLIMIADSTLPSLNAKDLA